MSSEVDSKKDLAVCLNLRCKEMFYKDDDPEAEQHQADVERVYGACDTTAYWCQCTQTGRGPDGKPVMRVVCNDASRKCFETIHFLT